VDIGSLIHSTHAAKVQNSIDKAVSDGAVVLAGAKRRSDLGPAFVEPTILGNVDPDSPIDTEETFGPVVSLHRVSGREEALSLANNSRYGLHASVWAGASGVEIARDIDAGSVGINSTLMIYNAFDVPMGGVKQSGIGRRHGERGILRYTQEQSIVRSFESGGGYDSLLKRIVNERRAALALRATRLWRKIPFLR
jgi:succinate-semialdehyde dehydrogenase/glutarate-semialdehyde dehydrogenase